MSEPMVTIVCMIGLLTSVTIWVGMWLRVQHRRSETRELAERNAAQLAQLTTDVAAIHRLLQDVD